MMEVYLELEKQNDVKRMEIRKTDLLDNNKCLSCLGPARDFRNDVSYIEYLYYSGLCQDCQDKR